jgi:hypothetical protein
MDEQNCVLSASILAPRGALEKQKTPQNEFLTSKFENSSSKKTKIESTEHLFRKWVGKVFRRRDEIRKHLADTIEKFR